MKKIKMTHSNFREIYLEDLYRFVECGNKYTLIQNNEILSPKEKFILTVRKNLSLIIRSYLAGTQNKTIDYYIENTIDELKFALKIDDEKVKEYKNTISRFFLNFYSEFIHNKHNILTGFNFAGGITENGIRVIASGDFTYLDKNKNTILVILDFSKFSYKDIFNYSFYQAAIINEYFSREGINTNINVFNINTQEKYSYNNPFLHKGILKSIINILKDFATSNFYPKFGFWCSSCIVKNQCFQKTIKG